MSEADFRQQQELEEERQQEALAVLHRVDTRTHTTADVLYLAHVLGVAMQFNQDIAALKAA